MKLLFSLVAATCALADDWAVIVAGSNSYGNYRHQADALHAYHVVRDFGIPAERIITMMYDDIANSKENPFKGKVFNRPTKAGTPGVDVYAGVKLDYTGEDVTPENFAAVLTGNSSAANGGKVLESTSKDRVFVNFVDHGGTGLIAFPHLVLMKAATLNAALTTMHDKNMYSKLVFYMEACESGSMFEGMVNPPGMYITTAANAKESSWGTYCPPDDKVDGKELNTCLGDLYSVNWLQNAEKAGKTETLEDQFDSIKKSTNKSHVMQYGDTSFTTEAIGDFMGGAAPSTTSLARVEELPVSNSHVASPDIPMHIAYYNYLRAEKADFGARMQTAEKLQKELTRRIQVDKIFYGLAQEVSVSMKGDHDTLFHAHPPAPVVCAECCDVVYAAFDNYCGGMDDYTLQYTRVVVNVCKHVEHEAAMAVKIAGTVQQLCKN